MTKAKKLKSGVQNPLKKTERILKSLRSMNNLARFLSVILGLCVIILYWFDWNSCEKQSPGFDGTFWNNYVVFFGYIMFVIVFFKNHSPNSSYTYGAYSLGAIGVSIVYGILIGAYKRAGAECGSLGEGMDTIFYYNTETYTPFLLNNIALALYAFFSLWEPRKIEKKGKMTEHGKTDNKNKDRLNEESLNNKKDNDSLVSKYKISDHDLKELHLLEKEKATLGIFSIKKEKLKSKSLKILKPYNVKFMDLGQLLNEIKNLNNKRD